MSWLTSSRRGARLVAPVTGVLLLAACTGGTPEAAESSTPAVVVTPSPTPTSTPTESPSVDVTVKPTRPAALDEPPSVDGAVAVAEYFVQLFPYINATGDLSAWSQLSHTDCIFCADSTSTVEAKVANGQHDEGGALTVTAASGVEVEPGAWYTVTVDFVQDPSVTKDATGAVVKEFPETKRLRSNIVTIWQNGTWSVRGVDSSTAPTT